MREILFRGKTIGGDWVYGIPCKSQDGTEMVEELYHVDGAEWNVESYEVIPETVGQFTGLTDKNGTKIFEGDVDQYGGLVLYDTLARFCIDYGHKVSLTYTESTFEITGNIHDK